MTIPENLTTAASDTLSPYHIVPNFREWTFPHHCVPAPWRTAPIAPLAHATVARLRDCTCRLTNHIEITESAHIIPAAEKEWFASNMMDTYCVLSSGLGPDAIDTGENALQIRQDVHSLWDRMMLSIVPKQDSGAQDSWTAHVNTPSQELHALYHNRQMQPLTGVRPEFLFARFAWDIFPRLRPFLSRNVSRRLKVRGDGVGDYTKEQCRIFCENQGRHRSISPRKGYGSPSKRQRQSSNDLSIHGDNRSSDSGVSLSSARDVDGDTERSEGEKRHFRTQEVENEEIDPIPEQDLDPHGHLRRKEAEVGDQSVLPHEPHGRKRRRDDSEDSEHEEELFGGYERRRGRQRRRSCSC